jgi:hypothetical protein
MPTQVLDEVVTLVDAALAEQRSQGAEWPCDSLQPSLVAELPVVRLFHDRSQLGSWYPCREQRSDDGAGGRPGDPRERVTGLFEHLDRTNERDAFDTAALENQVRFQR